MMSIATLTVNPALDVSVTVPHVVPGRKLRCSVPIYEPGGGGVNVARAVKNLGGNALAVVAIGGPTGARLMELLAAEGVQHQAVPVAGWTRENLNAHEEASGNQFRFCMPGVPLQEPEWRTLITAMTEIEPVPGIAVLSGSLPPGVPADFYARVGHALRARGSRIVLDASGEALKHGVGPHVSVLKVSVHELESLTGTKDADETRLVQLASEVVASSGCEVLVVSLGAGGALWVTSGLRERLAAPTVPVRSTVGAGDSMVAGIALALARGEMIDAALRLGVAAGAAAVMRPGTGLCGRDDVLHLLPQIAPPS